LPVFIGDSNSDFKFFKIGSNAIVKILDINRKEIARMYFSNLGK